MSGRSGFQGNPVRHKNWSKTMKGLIHADNLAHFGSKKIDWIFKYSSKQLVAGGSMSGDESSARQRDILRAFLADQVHEKQSARSAIKAARSQELRTLVLNVMQAEGEVNCEQYVHNSIPEEEYERLRRCRILKIMPIFWESVVLRLYGEKLVSFRRLTLQNHVYSFL